MSAAGSSERYFVYSGKQERLYICLKLATGNSELTATSELLGKVICLHTAAKRNVCKQHKQVLCRQLETRNDFMYARSWQPGMIMCPQLAARKDYVSTAGKKQRFYLGSWQLGVYVYSRQLRNCIQRLQLGKTSDQLANREKQRAHQSRTLTLHVPNPGRKELQFNVLKVQQHEIVDLWFFSIINPTWAPDSHPKIFSNSVSNSRNYSDLYVYQRSRIQC